VVGLVVMAILIAEIGVAPALVGMAFMLLVIPMQNYIAQQIGIIRRKMIHFTDERVKLINEMLQSIRIIKLYAWESAIEKRIAGIRTEETTILGTYLDAGGYLRELLFSVQPIIALVMLSLSAYAFDSPYDVVQTFRLLAFLSITRLPFNLLGQALKGVKDANVSIKRLNDFFLLPVIQRPTKSTQSTGPPLIKVDHATFTWEDTKKKQQQAKEDIETNENANETANNGYFQLQDISFTNMRANELIAVIGSVGSGKSSFLSAILQEMEQVVDQDTRASSCVIEGSVSYCSQVPWIQNLSVRQNILFEHFQTPITALSADLQALYAQSLEASALITDLAILPAGDETESKQNAILFGCFVVVDFCFLLCY